MAKKLSGGKKTISTKSMPMAGDKGGFSGLIGGTSNRKDPKNYKKGK